MILIIRKVDGKQLHKFRCKRDCLARLKITNKGFNYYQTHTAPQGWYISELTAKWVKDLGLKY